MSHIVSFRIDGLAGRKKSLKIDLNRNINIIFGLNGSGKTSLLKILHSAMSNETENLNNVPFIAADVSIYSMEENKTFTKSIKKPKELLEQGRVSSRVYQPEIMIGGEVVRYHQPSSDTEMKWSYSESKPKKDISVRWKHSYLPTTRLHVSDEPYRPFLQRSQSVDYRLTEEQLDEYFARSVEHLWSRYSSQVLGDVRKAQEQGLANILKVVLSTDSARRKRRKSKLTPTTAYSRVKNFLKRQGSVSILGTQKAFEKRYNVDLTLQNVVRDIDIVEDKIEAAMTSRNKLQELIERMFIRNKEIYFTDELIEVQTLNGDKIGLTSLSSGEKHLLWLLVQVLLVEGSSIMIDEPELSLHIDWQKDLINSLCTLNSTAQLILATHSPDIMANVSDDKIFNI